MEGSNEIKGLTQVWSSTFVCLAYCFVVVKQLPKGLARLLALLPIISIFAFLPLLVSSIHYIVIISGFITWICSSKLILFAFDQGPLSCDPYISFLHFIVIACLPVQVKQQSSPHHITKIGPKPPWNYSIKTLLLVLIIQVYNYSQHVYPNLILVLYCCHLYLVLELVLAVSAIPARVLLGFELEPQFNDPYMSTSLQDFWGRRWNLTITGIFRLTVYQPIKCVCIPIMGRNWPLLLCLLATFLVSGLMHELMYFYGSHVRPTWEVTSFFVLQGVCTCVEILVKRASGGRWHVHPIISSVLTISFVTGASYWLFFPQILRYRFDEKAIHEYSSIFKFLEGAIFHATT